MKINSPAPNLELPFKINSCPMAQLCNCHSFLGIMFSNTQLKTSIFQCKVKSGVQLEKYQICAGGEKWKDSCKVYPDPLLGFCHKIFDHYVFHQ
jgi:hypothetical protein